MEDLIVALSFFDKKVGPTVFIEISEEGESLPEDIKITLNQVFDQTINEGFFFHSLSGGEWSNSLNYYFEIKSDWARGLKEMLMCSLVLRNKLSSKKEHEVLSWVIDFVQKMRTKPNIYKAFYYSPNSKHLQPSKKSEEEMQENYEIVEKWLKDLYWAAKEEIRIRTDEEIIASLMIDDAIFHTIRKLSKYPLRMDELKQWFKVEKEFLRDFDKIIETLKEQDFIFINNLNFETYILLVKDVRIARVPPSCIVDLMENKEPDKQQMINYYISQVTRYFEDYEPKIDDSRALYNTLARSKHYNLIVELRKGPIKKNELSKILRHGPVIAASRINVLEELKQADIIGEFKIPGNNDGPYVLLKTDIDLKVQFPEYIQKAIPEERRDGKEREKLNLKKISSDLIDVYGEDGIFTGEEIFSKLSVQDVSGEETQIEVSELNSFEEDSPFDLIVDEITSKFIKEEPKEANLPSKKQASSKPA